MIVKIISDEYEHKLAKKIAKLIKGNTCITTGLGGPKLDKCVTSITLETKNAG